MDLSSELISQFVRATKDDKKTKSETTVYGTVVVYEGKTFVKIDGSDRLTPVSTTADVQPDERVMVTIKDHSATITGNMSSPAARTEDVKQNSGKIDEFDIVMSHKVTTDDLEAINAMLNKLIADSANVSDLTAITAQIERINAIFADIDHVSANNIEALYAEIESLRAVFGEFDNLSTEELEVINADIDKLKAYTADFTYVSADRLEALKANVKELDVKKLNAEDANIRFANIDFANITELAVENLNAKWGLIQGLTSENGVFTGELVGVTIKGDLIEGGTIKADKLIIKDSKDGLYYKLNFESGNFTDAEEVPEDGIHGKAIIAKSLTADQINVSDLVAFGAKIGGFNIADGAIYSGTKASVDNPTRGIYLDDDGQIALGDSTYFLRYFKENSYVRSDEESDVGDGILLNDVLTTSDDPVYVHTDDEGVKTYFTVVGETYYKVIVDEKYKLAISAESVWFGDDGKTSADDVRKLTEHVKIGEFVDPDTGDVNPSVELAEGDSDHKQVITNKKTMFMDGGMVRTTIDTDGVHANNLTADGEIRHGQYRWSVRPNGNYRLSWMEVDE